VVSGSSVLFWKDYWSNGELLCEKFPRLYSFALDEDLSVAELAQVEDLSTCFAVPISVEVFHEWQQISQLLMDTPLSENAVDLHTFVWGDKYTPLRILQFLVSAAAKRYCSQCHLEI
jgi:hypothetical protein